MEKVAGLAAANIIEDCLDQNRCAILNDFLECSVCHQIMPSLRQLKLHEFKQHGTICLARQCVGMLNYCPTCLRRYPTRTQAVEHLRTNAKCAEFEQHRDCIDPVLVAELDALEIEREKTANRSCRPKHLETLAGPLLKAFVQSFKGRPRPISGKVIGGEYG